MEVLADYLGGEVLGPCCEINPSARLILVIPAGLYQSFEDAIEPQPVAGAPRISLWDDWR